MNGFFFESFFVENGRETIGRPAYGKFDGEGRVVVRIINTSRQIVSGAAVAADEIIVNQAEQVTDGGLAGRIGTHDDDILAHLDLGAFEKCIVFCNFIGELSWIGEINIQILE